MENISSAILMSVFLILAILCMVLIAITKDKDKGCNFDCKHCPFPECSPGEKESIRKLQRNGDKE